MERHIFYIKLLVWYQIKHSLKPANFDTFYNCVASKMVDRLFQTIKSADGLIL